MSPGPKMATRPNPCLDRKLKTTESGNEENFPGVGIFHLRAGRESVNIDIAGSRGIGAGDKARLAGNGRAVGKISRRCGRNRGGRGERICRACHGIGRRVRIDQGGIRGGQGIGGGGVGCELGVGRGNTGMFLRRLRVRIGATRQKQMQDGNQKTGENAKGMVHGHGEECDSLS